MMQSAEDYREYPISQALELLDLHKALWDITTRAIAMEGPYPPSTENERVERQLGRLIRVLARKNIHVIDETQED